MADIRFDDEQQYAPASSDVGPKGFAARLIAWGVVKDERQAEYALLGIAVAAFVLSIIVFSSFGGTKKPIPWQPPPPEDLPAGFAPSAP